MRATSTRVGDMALWEGILQVAIQPAAPVLVLGDGLMVLLRLNVPGVLSVPNNCSDIWSLQQVFPFRVYAQGVYSVILSVKVSTGTLSPRSYVFELPPP